MKGRKGFKNGGNADNEAPPSRSAKKRNCLALQKLGEELANFSLDERNGLNLPAELAEALDMHDRLGDREAKRRQRQYIGRLMRELDAAPIAQALARRKNQKMAQTSNFQKAEKLRGALIACARANRLALIEEAARENGWQLNESDREKLLKLVERSAEERESGQRKTAQRQLFRELAALFSASQEESELNA